MTNSNNSLKKTGKMIAGSLLAGSIISLGSVSTGNAANLYDYNDLGDGSEVRTSLLERNFEIKCGDESNCGGKKKGEGKKAKDSEHKCGEESNCGGKKGEGKKAKKASNDEKKEEKSKSDFGKCGEAGCGAVN